MTHEAVSAPVLTQHGAHGSGRAPSSTPTPPALDGPASELLASMGRWEAGKHFVDNVAIVEFLHTGHQSTRSGMQVIDYLAWALREAARAKYPEDAAAEIATAVDLEKVSKATAGALVVAESLANLADRSVAAIAKAYEDGFSAGQTDVKKSLPTVIREKTLHENDKGHVTKITEKEYHL